MTREVLVLKYICVFFQQMAIQITYWGGVRQELLHDKYIQNKTLAEVEATFKFPILKGPNAR
jgi:hypothetical protein